MYVYSEHSYLLSKYIINYYLNVCNDQIHSLGSIFDYVCISGKEVTDNMYSEDLEGRGYGCQLKHSSP